MLIKISVIKDGYKCERCEHEWIARANNPDKLPAVCPGCNSPYWNTPRKNKVAEVDNGTTA